MIIKMVEKGLKKGLQTPKRTKELTPTQKEILRLITEEFLDIKQITIRRGCSKQAVYKMVKKLREKGVLSLSNQMVEKSEGTYLHKGKTRLHGQEFNIRILWQDQFYHKNLRKSNVLYLDGNLVKLYRNSLEIYSSQSFFGENEQEADSKSMEYWKRLVRRLENDLKVILIKNRARNIKEVKHEYAHTDSEICENALNKKERIWVYAEEDGKLAFLTDDSFGFKEDETVHPQTAKHDRKAIDRQVNDWRLNDPPTLSELHKNQAETGKNLKILVGVVSKQAKMYADFPKQIQSHLKLIQEYRKENIAWRKEKVREIKKELKYGRQTRLQEFK